MKSAPSFLWWQTRQLLPVFTLASLLSVLNSVSLAAFPFVLGRTVDGALDEGVSRPLLMWCLVIAGIGVIQVASNVAAHRYVVYSWLQVALGTMRMIGHHATRTGSAITRELPTGEVVATVATDAYRLGDLYAHGARVLGGVATYIVVGVVLLDSSVPLGVAVLVGLPLVAAILTFVIRPLERRQRRQREASGKLTTLGSDTVAGLRILRGIGGEEVFNDRYRTQSQKVRRAGVHVAQMQALLAGIQTLLPGLFVAAVVWFGAHMALRGEISVGQLVTFYGYASFLGQPLQATIEGVQHVTRAVIAARKVVGVMSTKAEIEDFGTRPAPASAARLHHTTSGLELAPGELVAVVSADPDVSARVVTELARLADPSDHVLWDGYPLSEYPVSTVREHIVLSEATPALFSGRLDQELSVRPGIEDSDVLSALEVADAHDVLESMPDGLHGEIAEKGRSLSGGQRQRVSLARALLTDAENLLLLEPTSAVDAHTEARIASRLRSRRQGRTTAVVTASPLVLEQVDRVVFIEEGKVTASGSHPDLLGRAHAGETAAQRYQQVVSRSTGDSETQSSIEDQEVNR